MQPMRRIAAVLVIALTAAGCGVDLYESPDFGAVDAGADVVLWRLAQGSEGFVGIGGPIQADDLADEGKPLTLGSYRSTDGRTWETGQTLGSIEAPLLGLTAWEDGYAASGMWDGVAAVMVSTDGLTWQRFDLPADGADTPNIESAGIAAADGAILLTGFAGEPVRPILWVVDPLTGPVLVDTADFPREARLPQATVGPAGFVASAIGTVESSTPPPIWVSTDGHVWNPVFDPFEGDTIVTGLIGSTEGYVAVVAEDGSDDRFTLWTSTDGIDWTRRADQDSVFGHLTGKGGDLLADLAGWPDDNPQPRPIAFSFNGRWLEITEAVAGERFVPVAVAGDATTRLISGFIGGDQPIPLVLVAGG